MKFISSTAVLLMAFSPLCRANILACEGVNKSSKSQFRVIRDGDRVVQVVYKTHRVFTDQAFELRFDPQNAEILENLGETYKLDILGKDQKDLHAQSIASVQQPSFELVVQGTSPIDGLYHEGYAHFICHTED